MLRKIRFFGLSSPPLLDPFPTRGGKKYSNAMDGRKEDKSGSQNENETKLTNVDDIIWNRLWQLSGVGQRERARILNNLFKSRQQLFFYANDGDGLVSVDALNTAGNAN